MIKVNGYEISEKEFDMALEERKYVLKKNALDRKDIEDVKDILIDGALMLKTAQDEKIEVAEADIEDMISKMKQNFKTEKDFEDVIAKTGDTPATLRERIERNLKLRNFVMKKFFEDTKVSDDDMQKYYDTYPERFIKGEEIRASHILFSEADKDKALEVHELLLNGEDFADHAKLHSSCPSGENGGDLGYFDRGKMVPEFEQVAFDTAVGQVSDLVQTQFGYHIIKITDKREGGKFELDEVKESLQQAMINSIVNHKIQSFTSKLRETAEIMIDKDIFTKKISS